MPGSEEERIRRLLEEVKAERMRAELFYLAKDPLPFRKLNFTLPGHGKNTLYEADDHIQSQLEACSYAVWREECKVQAFRPGAVKPQFERPHPDDPWYVAYNLYAERRGTVYPDEIILLLSHKDSQSWIDSPGAYDNAVGTVANMEIARLLSDYEPKRTIRFLFCNEEHTPWTSVTAAKNARERGDNLIAIINIDSLGGKSQEAIEAGLKTNVTLYTTPEGERLADLMIELNERYHIGLVQSKARRERPGDDDGSFIMEGFSAAVMNVGSFPYADPCYHRECDEPGRVDIVNVRLATQLTLAACLYLDAHGFPEGKS